MGITAFPFTAVIDVPTARILGRDDAGTGAAEALTNTEIFAILGTGTPSASTYLRGDGTWATVSAGVGGSTGSVDNAVLMADGTGGVTLQASAIVITDNFTASPNATVNHASIQATGGTTNVSVSVVPKGTGSFSLHVPDGTAAGGNARGANAIDMSTSRTTAAQVASGAHSFQAGRNLTASGQGAVAFGDNNTSTSFYTFVAGQDNNVTGSAASAIAYQCTASGSRSGVYASEACTASGSNAVVIGGLASTASAAYARAFGQQAVADRFGMTAEACGSWFSNVHGAAQRAQFIARNRTTNNTATTLFLDGASARLTIPSGKLFLFIAKIVGVKSDGTSRACYIREGAIININGTTSLVGSITTIGADHEDNAATDVEITADDTNDALQINVTGITSETWRWVAVVEGVEVAYGI